MIDLIDFNDCKETYRTYGGNAGRKVAVKYEDSDWILKFPGNLKDYPDINLDYSISPISEFLGSHIYGHLDIPVHNTILGTFKGKNVVGCKDFCADDKLLSEFRTYKATGSYAVSSSTEGDGTSLSEVLDIIDNNQILKQVEDVSKRFWNMFYVDAFIGNPDRNNGNWGLLVTFPERKIISLAPVYDNGNSLNSKWDDSRMRNFLKRASKQQRIENSSISVYLDKEGKKIRPFQFMMQTEITECHESIVSLFEKIDMDSIDDLIEEIHKSNLISDLQADFYHILLNNRYDLVLKERYEHSQEILSTCHCSPC